MIQWKYFDIIAKEVDEQNTINAVYIKLKKDIEKVDELSVVCIVNFLSRSVGAPAYLGSYQKFREPVEIRNINLKKDNLKDLKKMVLSLPEEELLKLNDLFDTFLKMKTQNLVSNNKNYEERRDLDSNKNEIEDISFPDILDEEIEEYLIEMAARYNYFFAQKDISRKSEKTLRKESHLQDDLYFELAELCYNKYYGQ